MAIERFEDPDDALADDDWLTRVMGGCVPRVNKGGMGRSH